MAGQPCGAIRIGGVICRHFGAGDGLPSACRWKQLQGDDETRANDQLSLQMPDGISFFTDKTLGPERS